jgi:hypothetical protein
MVVVLFHAIQSQYSVLEPPDQIFSLAFVCFSSHSGTRETPRNATSPLLAEHQITTHGLKGKEEQEEGANATHQPEPLSRDHCFSRFAVSASFPPVSGIVISVVCAAVFGLSPSSIEW